MLLCIVTLVYRHHYLSAIAKAPQIFLGIVILYIAIFFITINALPDIVLWIKRGIYNISDLIDSTLSEKTKKCIICIYFAILAIIHYVCFFTYYPGLASYDYKSSYQQAMGIVPLSDHHPIMYTLIWKLFQIIAGIIGKAYYADVFYAMFQIALVLITYYHILRWMKKRGFPILILIISGIYYLIVPTFHLFALSPTKDVPFACALIFFVTNMADYLKGEGKWYGSVFWGIATCLFRHNMTYILIALLIGLFVFKADKKKIVIAMVPSIIVAVLLSKVIIPLLGISNTESAEYLSVPLQQISALYSFEAYFTEEERDIIEAYIPDVEDYNYRFVDPIKDHFNNGLYLENSSDFWKVWFSGLKQNPMIYLCAAIDTNVQLIMPDSEINDEFSQREYIELNQNSGAADFALSRLFSFLKPFYDTVGSATQEFMYMPVIHWYYSLSFPFYSLLLSLFALLRRKEHNSTGILIVTVFLLLLGTYLLGPVSNFRYCYPIYLACPIYLGIVFVCENRRIYE